MTPVRLVVALVAAAILVAPTAAAAVARGEVAAGIVALPEGGEIVSAGLDILARGEGAAVLELQATDVAIHRVGTTRAVVGGLYSVEYGSIDESQTFSQATLALDPGVGEQIVALRALGPATAALAAGEMKGVEGALLASAHETDTCDEVGVSQSDSVPYCIDVRGVYELVGDASAQIAGELVLLVYGPTLVVRAEGASTSYASGAREDADGVRSEDAWVVVRAKDVAGSVSGSAVSLFAAAPTISTPQAVLEGADGLVQVGSRDYRASSDDIVVKGALVLSPGPVAPTTQNGYGNLGAIYAAGFTTRISGDIQSINLNAAPAFLDSTAEKGILAAIIGLAIAGIAYAWQHLAFLAAALYTRLQKPDILDNDVRNRIYDIIRENPGISAREVHRRSEQSWGTVVYHLRQLERHHLVVSRSLGRTRNYYENHGKYRGMEVQLACLQSDRARVLARAITAQPGITQEQLAAASGYPQPTTSYYVRKLKQAGLVEEQREGRYVKYVPHADLPRFIAMSEQAPGVSTAAPTGVQA